MACLGCNKNTFVFPPFAAGAFGSLASISRAMAKSAGARIRSVGALPISPLVDQRLAICRRCPLYHVSSTGQPYCGKPFLKQIVRNPSLEGCGCPLPDKARSPAEHCPLTRFNQPARRAHGTPCNCKWCAISSNGD